MKASLARHKLASNDIADNVIQGSAVAIIQQ
jgi:hypothetical protein